MLPPLAGGSLKHNRGKMGCSIEVVLKVVSTPARVWKRGARCFAGRFTLGLDEAPAVFGRNDDLGINLQERDTRISFTPYV